MVDNVNGSGRVVRVGAIVFLLVGLLAVPVGATDPAPAAVPVEDDLVLTLWNGLGSLDEIENSVVGPALAVFDPEVDDIGGDKVGGVPLFVPGVVGNALSMDDLPFGGPARVQNVILRDPAAVLSAERGRIDVSFRQSSDPVPFEHNIYRIFDGPFGSGHTIELWSADPLGLGTLYTPGETEPRLMFGPQFSGVTARFVGVTSLADGRKGVDISARNGEWLHLVAEWDRAGIDGSDDTVRLSVDAELVATAQDDGWGTTVSELVDIGGGNDDPARRFAVDELKVFAPRGCGGLAPTIVGTGGTTTGTAGDDVISGTSGPDRIFGLGGDDVICGIGGDDILVGGDGDDRLIGGSGSDAMRGGSGTDTADYSDSPGPVHVALNLMADDGVAGEGDRIDPSVENVIGSAHDDELLGNALGNRLDGAGGDDVISGRGGDDVLVGGADADRLIGGPGADELRAGDGVDYCRGSAGFDRYFGCETALP